ncbi:MAG TPA: hypothetical protein PKA82_00485 [Pyrinomonadaceae bacterium]|nr:hypothetical protein [Pyrinomonadaceae bacterium]
MNNARSFFASLMVLATVFTVGISAQSRNERDVRDALRALTTNLENFEYDLRYQLQSTSSSGNDVQQAQDDIRALRDNIRQFQDNFERRRENRSDVDAIISSARTIHDNVLKMNSNRRVSDGWSNVRKQIERIASNYNVTPDWDGDFNPQGVPDKNDMGGQPTITVGLSGTYDLDFERSEKVDEVLDSANVRGTLRDDLKEKLAAPGQIAIDIRGRQVTLASTTASPVTFMADGTEKTEQGANGRTIRLRATLSGDTLTVASLGGDTDYTITLTSASDGRVLKVSRRITTEGLDQTIFVDSTYNKTDGVARLGIDTSNPTNTGGGYSDNDSGTTVSNGGGAPTISTLPRTGTFIVANGTTVTGTLENEINTKVSQNNDRFRLTVTSPEQYRGAVIDGYISGVDRSGKISGRSNITFNFERITLRDGKIYDFAGSLQSATDANGKVIKVDTEGTAKGGSQTKESVKRGGIGAGLGALIGAIAGGAKGAAIGAIIGGGAGAGSTVLTGREDLRLEKGSKLTVISSSPIR